MKKTRLLFARYLTLLVLALLSTNLAWGETKTLTFDLTSNPGSWPTANSTTLTNYTYKLDNVDYTFGLKNVKCNSGYLMLTSTAVLGLPAIEGYKLTKVVAKNSGGCSTSTKVGVSSSSSSASYISGGAIQTWSTTSSSYTYNLSGTSNNTVYYLYVTNKNAQITELALTYEGQSGPVAVEAPTFSVAAGNYTEAQTVELSCETEGASIYYTTDGTEPSAESTPYESAITVDHSMTIKAIAIKEAEKSTVATAAYKINVFTSLEDLVAAEIADGTTVKVSFENVMITDIFTNFSDKRVGIFLNVKAKNDKDIEIYFNNTAEGKTVPDAWIVGGKVSGTLTCPWTYYKNGDVWELCPDKDSEWTWGELTYTAPTTYNIIIADDIQNGTVEADMETAAEGVEVTLTINPEEGYKLSTLTVTDASSNPITVSDNKFIMPASNVTVSATFEAIPTHEAKFFVNGVQYGETQNVPEGDEVVFPEEDPAAIGTRTFVGWTASPMPSASDEAPEFVESATMGTEDLNFYAVFAKKTETPEIWNKVTDASTLAAKDVLRLAATASDSKTESCNGTFAASAFEDKTFFNSVKATITDDKLTSDGAIDITLGGESGAWTLTTSEGQITTSEAKKFKLNDGNQKTCTIAIDDNGNATITFGDYGKILYNRGSPRFLNYTSSVSASMILPYIFRKSGGITYSNYCTLAPVTATITKTGYATFSCDYALDLDELPEGLTAYYATYTTGASVILMKVAEGAVAAKTGLFLKGTAETSYDIPVAATGTTIDANILEPTTGEALQIGDYVYYIKEDGEFRPLGSALVVNKGKAYIPASKIDGEPAGISFEGSITGIEEIESQSTVNGQQSTAVYNLQGIRVTTPKKGEVYIMNGKKYVCN